MTETPKGELSKFHHVNFTVSNAMQAAYWYCACFGFKKHAELNHEFVKSIVVKNEKVMFVFTSSSVISEERRQYITKHGDCVRDVAFAVENLELLIRELRVRGTKLVKDICISEDEFGCVRQATIQAKDSDVRHTLIENINYRGPFLPGYKAVASTSTGFLGTLSPLPVIEIDHVVQNFPKDKMEDIAGWYKENLKLHRFWSIDDTICTSDFSAMKAWLVVNHNQKVQMTIAEPVEGTHRGRSQIQEYVDYNGGPGIQHIALRVVNIIDVVSEMRSRSIEFLSVPASYYDDLRKRLKLSKVNVTEDIAKLQELSILVDFDDNGYLLQIFTKPVQDRPTLFLEVIQRYNFNGFGAGNFKALFDAIEREQAKRGTLEKEQ